MRSLHDDIVVELKNVANPAHAKKDKRYHKYAGHKGYGIKSPDLDRILKKYKKDIIETSCTKSLETAQELYQSGMEEQLLAGNYILQLKNDCLALPKHARYLDRLADNFMSWSTVDDFCINVLQPLLLRQPKETLTLLRKWNKSKSMWKRRASVVAFVRKVGESGQFTKKVIELCDNLKHDPEDLVQKSVGWALKDAMRGDKKRVLEYVMQLRREGIPSTITLYAIRDLKGKERESVLCL